MCSCMCGTRIECQIPLTLAATLKIGKNRPKCLRLSALQLNRKLSYGRQSWHIDRTSCCFGGQKAEGQSRRMKTTTTTIRRYVHSLEMQINADVLRSRLR